jgi:hypothetical protein
MVKDGLSNWVNCRNPICFLYFCGGEYADRITDNDLLGSLTGGGTFIGESPLIIFLDSLKGLVRFLGLIFQNYGGPEGKERLIFDSLF